MRQYLSEHWDRDWVGRQAAALDVLPASTIFFLPNLSRCSARSVPVKELGCCLCTTFSDSLASLVSSGNSSASSVCGVNKGAPSGVLWRTCTWYLFVRIQQLVISFLLLIERSVACLPHPHPPPDTSSAHPQ